MRLLKNMIRKSPLERGFRGVFNRKGNFMDRKKGGDISKISNSTLNH